MSLLPPAPVVRYGEHPDHVANLHLPAGAPPFPVVVLLHGGFWRARWDRTLLTPLALDLARRGYAAWNVEFRRVGQDGGGWPGTLQDVQAALAALASVPELGAGSVALVGHSSGGHLALLAACGRPDVSTVFALGAITDIERARELDPDAVDEFLGEAAERVPDRLAAASPVSRLPLGVRQVLVHGKGDPTVPVAMSVAYAEAARQAGDEIELVLVAGADHFDVVDPAHYAWREVTDRLEIAFARSAHPLSGP